MTVANKNRRVAKLVQTAQGVITLFTVIAITVVAVLTYNLRHELQFYVEEPVDNAEWNITQLEMDATRFQAEAEIVAAAPDRSLDELRERFDLFYSRAKAVIEGQTFRQLGLAAMVEDLRKRLLSYLADTAPVMDGDDSILRASVPHLMTDADELRQYLRNTSIKFVQQGATMDDHRRRSFVSLVWGSIWASAFVIVALMMLLFLIQWLNRIAQRRATETSRISSRLSATVSTSLDAIIVTDAFGNIMDYNAAAHQTFGYLPKEAIGMNVARFVDPSGLREAERAGAPTERDADVPGSGRVETIGHRKSGESFPIELSIATTAADEGQIHIAYLRDISPRKDAEHSLLAARDAALAADQAKTNFLAVMSHEMRTPLNGVLASLELLSDMQPSKEQKRFLSLAQTAADQLLRHVNDVLDLSKIDAGKVVLSHEPFDLVRQVEDLVATFRPVARSRLTDLRVNVLSAPPVVIGDSFRFGQILQNLVSNATKFTPNGTVTVEIEVTRRSGSTVTVEVRVIDTGIGIAETDQERIFGEFIMVDPSYRRTDGGTGLGLAISRRLAVAMGGEIGVESDPGEGSCFWFSLPFEVAETSVQADPVDRAFRPGKRLDVLLVEDNAINRVVVEEMLRQLGHSVTMAEDGAQGLEIAAKHRFDVILMDISMPRMDGITATRMIRASGASAKSRIVALTAHSLPSDLEKFRAAGMEACLTKPVSRADLAQYLGRHEAPAGFQAETAAILDVDRQTELVQALGVEGRIRILTLFSKDIETLAQDIIAACERGDAEEARALTHQTAGAAATVGATRLQAHMYAAESLCIERQLDAVLSLAHEETGAICAETAREIRLMIETPEIVD